MTYATLRRIDLTDVPATGDLQRWLDDLLATYSSVPFKFVLALATDGFTWGSVIADGAQPKVHTSHELLQDWSPRLGASTTELRLFTDDQGEGGAELHLWRTGRQFKAALLEDVGMLAAASASQDCACLDTVQVLSGTICERAEGAFLSVCEGEGLRHAPPAVAAWQDFSSGDWRPLRLHVRDYAWPDDDDAGVCRIRASRLSGISKQSRPQEAR